MSKKIYKHQLSILNEKSLIYIIKLLVDQCNEKDMKILRKKGYSDDYNKWNKIKLTNFILKLKPIV